MMKTLFLIIFMNFIYSTFCQSIQKEGYYLYYSFEIALSEDNFEGNYFLIFMGQNADSIRDVLKGKICNQQSILDMINSQPVIFLSSENILQYSGIESEHVPKSTFRTMETIKENIKLGYQFFQYKERYKNENNEFVYIKMKIDNYRLELLPYRIHGELYIDQQGYCLFRRSKQLISGYIPTSFY